MEVVVTYEIMKYYEPVCRICGEKPIAKQSKCVKCRDTYDKELIRLTKLARKRAYYTTWKIRTKSKR
jgi:tRNA(Ile2) C34 agmatinyltransferase TiaS